MIRLWLFDFDGTLVSSYMDNPDKAYDRWSVVPGAARGLARLVASGRRIGIVTNQAGVAFGFVDPADVFSKINTALAALGLPQARFYTSVPELATATPSLWPDETPVSVCFAHPNAREAVYRDPRELARRKPGGAMICEQMVLAGIDDPRDVVFVGDSAEDAGAAAAAGCAFLAVRDFLDQIAGNPPIIDT